MSKLHSFKLAAVLIALLPVSCNTDIDTSQPQDLNTFLENYLRNSSMNFPERMTDFGIYSEESTFAYNSELNDASEAFYDKMNTEYIKYLDTLHSFNKTDLTNQEQLSYDILEWDLNNKIEGHKYTYDYPVNHMWGIHQSFPAFMTETHQINNEKDVEDYLARLSKVSLKFDQTIERLKTRERNNVVPHKSAIQTVLDQMNGFYEGDVLNNPLYTSLQDRMGAMGISSDKKLTYLEKAKASIETDVLPAYQKLIAYFEHLDSITTDEIGLWRFENGDEYYAFVLKRETNTDMSPEEVHQLAQKEIDRIMEAYKVPMDSAGFEGETLMDQYFAFRSTVSRDDERYFFKDTSEAGKTALLNVYRSMIEEVQDRLTPVFSMLPKTRMEIREMPAIMAGGPGGYYEPPSYDGSRPGVFYVNLSAFSYKPSIQILTYHEAVPGHHYQVALHRENLELPRFRGEIYYSGFHEGWADYGVVLAMEYGLINDLPTKFFMLRAQLARAIRALIDTGMHYKKWSKQKAIDKTEEYWGSPWDGVDRYIVSPGQGCGYMVGRLKFLELREKAKRELGDKFNIRDFHDLVLKNGSMPLTLLDRNVERWIEKKKSL